MLCFTKYDFCLSYFLLNYCSTVGAVDWWHGSILSATKM